MTDRIVIVGGGLAGLHAARRLTQAGVPFVLHEARRRLGGRIFTADAAGAPTDDGFDLGPSWFWPRLQPAMAALVDELGLQAFPQHSDGDVVIHRMSREAPQRYRGTRQEPESMRLVGGTGALVRAIAATLPSDAIRLGSSLTHLSRDENGVEARFVEADDLEVRLRACHVVLAVPPRLLAARVTFSPGLDEATVSRWRGTATWMAPHAKLFALYNRPFWREAGLSGTAQSMVGPLVEIHDAATASGHAALFGFVGMPVVQRQAMGREALVGASIRQLTTLFGPEAATPRATLVKDWAADPLTATDEDRVGGAHPVADGLPWLQGAWAERITLTGSETSPVEPGYLAGAVAAAELAVADLLQRLARRARG